MARKKNGVNKSEQIRELLRGNPTMPVKEVVANLAGRGLSVTDNLVYFIKGKMKGRRGRKMKVREMVEKVAVTTGSSDAVATILKVKRWAAEVGGIKKLKALVDALSA